MKKLILLFIFTGWLSVTGFNQTVDITFTITDSAQVYSNLAFSGSWLSGYPVPMSQDNLEWTVTLPVEIPAVPLQHSWGAFGDMGPYTGIWLIYGVNLIFYINPDGSIYGDTTYVIPPGIDQAVTVSFTVNIADSLEAGLDFTTLGIFGSTPTLEWNWGTITNPVYPVPGTADTLWDCSIDFPVGSPYHVEFKYGRNGLDLEGPWGVNHYFFLNDTMPSQHINCTYGIMGPVYCYTANTSSEPPNGGTTTGDGAYSEGSTVMIEAIANQGYLFDNWTEADTVVSTDMQYSFFLDTNRFFVAHFSIDTLCTLVTLANPPEGGTTTGDSTYMPGDSVTVCAYKNEYYEFISWTEDGTIVSTDSCYSYIIQYDMTLVANFAIDEFTVTTAAVPPEGGTATGDGIYPAGSVVGVMATANPGYLFDNWTENDTIVSTDSTYTFSITSDRDFEANFSPITYNVTTSADPPEGGSTSGDGTYNWGDSATVTANANMDWEFESWTRNDTVISENSSYTFMVSEEIHLVAKFISQVMINDHAPLISTINVNPNPASQSVAISYQLSVSSFVELVIYDMNGQIIATLISHYQQKGNHKINWNAEGLVAGIYLYRLTAGNRSGKGKVAVR